ncbi:hypothetical protein BH10PAT2_BH10PAT2_1970 [soil metagenome]
MPNNRQQRFWFKRKCYGFGWYPATWEAWVILLFYILIVVINAFRMDSEALTATQIMSTIFPATIILTIILIVVCYQTGESPIWQWGGKPIKRVKSMKKNVKNVKTKKRK